MFSIDTTGIPVSACKINSTALQIQTATKKQSFSYKVKYPQVLQLWRNPWEWLGSETDWAVLWVIKVMQIIEGSNSSCLSHLCNTGASLAYRLIEISPLSPKPQIIRNSAALGFPAPSDLILKKRLQIYCKQGQTNSDIINNNYENMVKI